MIYQFLKVANAFICVFIAIFKEGDLRGRTLHIRLDENRLQMFSAAPDQKLGTFLYLDLPLSADVCFSCTFSISWKVRKQLILMLVFRVAVFSELLQL